MSTIEITSGEMLAVLLFLCLFLVVGCGAESEGDAGADARPANPLLAAWETPFGVPPFHEIRHEHYLPAFREAMDRHKAEVQAIIENDQAPTFDNTIEALERSGALLRRVASVFFPINGAHSDEEIRKIAKEISPKLSSHSDDIMLSADLFARVDAVYEQREALDLDADQERLLSETHKAFVRSGVGLEEKDKTRLREINEELAALSQEFSQNLLAETNDFVLIVERREDLGDLPASLVAMAADEAKKRGKEGRWAFTLQRPSINPFLQYSPNREMRRALFEGYAARGDRGNPTDNKTILSRMADLRAERASLLGYSSHADYVLADNMAESASRVYALLDQVWKPAKKAAERERVKLTEWMHDDGVPGKLEAWDWRYYAEKVRKAEFDFDEEETRPYFEVHAVRDGVFEVAKRLFGLTFEEREDLPVWHEDQQAFEVKEADGRHVGIVYLDFFARESKRGGAWMNSIRSQSKLDGVVTPIVTTNFNFPAPTESSPSLLSFSEAQTLFHEFGHALHGLLSDVVYESMSGTSVPRDYVEFPSQVMENWMSEPEVLKLYARHYESGEVIPDALVEKIQAGATFNQGFSTVEYMAACYLDMAWHTLTEPKSLDPSEYETATMKKIGMIDEIIPRYRSTYFAHIFAGGYASGYYGYLWAEVLDADAFEAFKQAGLFDRETAEKFRVLLSRGGSRPGMDLYREFRGRDPEIAPLLQRRGFARR